MGLDDDRRRRGARGRPRRPRLHVHGRRGGRARDRQARRGRLWRRRVRGRRCARGDGEVVAERRAARARVVCALGGRPRALGPEGEAPRPPARAAARGRPRRGADLRERRLLHVPPRGGRRAARRLGRGRHPAGEDEGRSRARGRRGTGGIGPRGDRGGGRALRRRERRVLAEAGARLGGAVRGRMGGDVVRGAGLLGRRRGGCGCCATTAPPGSRSRPGSTATSSATSSTCSARSTACRRT